MDISRFKMFKLLVLSALLGAAVAEPGLLSSLQLPIAYDATFVAPATTSTYVQHSSSYVAPTVYSNVAYPHFIKKRSPQFLSNYVAPYVAGAPLVTPYASTYIAPAPITYSSPVVSAIAAPAHFIKKRSAPLIAAPASYIAPAPLAYNSFAAAPLATTYSSAIFPNVPYYSPYYSNYLPTWPLLKK